MSYNNFSVSSLLSNLNHLSRTEMIAELEKLYEDNLKNNRREAADKITGILSVIRNGIKPFDRFLSSTELEDIRPTMRRFVNEGSIEEGTFRRIYPK
jgi:hypothetical protein